MEKIKYYSIRDRLLKYNAQYYIAIGERSNGKTYSTLDYCLEEYCTKGHKLAIIRRYADDFRGKRGREMFSSLVKNDLVSKYTNGKWDNIYYYSSCWYLCKWDDKLNKRIMDEEPFAYAFGISTGEHDKSTSYPDICNILFDEFLARAYLPDEFILFMNVLSTIIRDRDNIKIFMLGNTVNMFSPYFDEMGIDDVKYMEQGTIKEYSYGESDLKVVLEFSDFPSKKKKSDKYFAFNNPKLQMITNGKWEMDIYPHLPIKYKKEDIVYLFFISFNEILLQCEVIHKDNYKFIYVHYKTTKIKDDDNDLIFTNKYSMKRNYSINFKTPRTMVEKKIYEYFKQGKVCFQDNRVGEYVTNFIKSL